MKHFYQVCLTVFFVLIPVLPFCMASEPEVFDKDIDEEFKWLREEAEFVTIATKTKMTSQEAPSIVSVITGDEIRNMGARNIGDVIRNVPGFDLICGTDTYSRMHIRGMNSQGLNKNIKMMIDGHTLQSLGADEFERMPVAGISKIEIIRGPGSALYGTGAFLGVINIVTFKGGEKPSRVSLEAGSFDTLKPYAEFSYARDDFRAYLYADYYKTDGYDAEIGTDAAANAPVFPDFGPMYIASASRDMTNDTSHYNFRTRIDYKDFYISGFLHEADSKCPVGVLDVVTDEDDIKNFYGYGEAGFRLPLNDDQGNLLMKMYYDYTYFEVIYEMLPEETAEKHIGFLPGEGVHEGPAGKYAILGGELTGDYEIHPGINLTGGAAYEHFRHFDLKHYSNYNSGGFPIEVDGKIYQPFPPYERFPGGLTDIWEQGVGYEEADANILALYGQGTLDMKSLFFPDSQLKTLSLTAGLRYDDYRNKGDETGVSTFSSLSPRFGLSYAPTDKLWFKMLYGEAFRAPTLDELYLRGNLYLGQNKDLKPEKLATVEGLVGYRFAKNITASLTGFYIRVRDMIDFDMGDDGVFRPINIGKKESVGAEFEFKAGLGEYSYVFMNFTWQDVQDMSNKEIGWTGLKQEDFNPGDITEFSGNIGVNYGITENIITNISLNYLGERERTGEKIWDGEKLVPADSRDPVEEYWLLNTSLTFRNFPAKGMEFQISGFNLLDEDYRSPDEEGLLADDIPCPGRSYTGRISYSF
ncbi:TonB-dependent receptor [Desulfococcaceae bacterium HSG8]|nr:TonB-dependent receptor [Desulfococcaceae bacterium HSG8]